MHYYQFNISDYLAHTQHFDEIEDLAYRRMLDIYYLHESPLPDDVEDIARLIRMRTHCERIATVLRECFELHSDGWHNKRADEEIKTIQAKSNKARESARKRWGKKESEGNANALQSQCEGNATQDTRHKTHNTKSKSKRFTPPAQIEVEGYMNYELGLEYDAANSESLKFMDYYTANGWKAGKNPMKDWKATARNWVRRIDQNKPPQPTNPVSFIASHTDTSWADSIVDNPNE